MNSDDELIVNNTDDFTCLTGEGSTTGSQTETKIASITLTASTLYTGLEATISCFRDTVARIVAVEDVGVTDVETELVPGIRVGAGNFNFSEVFECLGKFTSGSTGVLELQLLAANLNSVSDIDASLGVKEAA